MRQDSVGKIEILWKNAIIQDREDGGCVRGLGSAFRRDMEEEDYQVKDSSRVYKIQHVRVKWLY